MESALCHRHGHLPGLTLRIPNFPVNGASRVITRPHFSFNPSSLSLSNTNLCIYRRLGHAFSPIACAMNRNPTPWRNDESDSKVVRAGTVGASLMLACAFGIISCGCMKSPKAMAICKNQKKTEVVCINRDFYPEGNEAALKYLSDMISVYSSEKKPASFMLNANKKVSKEEAAILKKEAMWMVKSGKDNDAVRLLKTTLEKCDGSESKFFVEMALVEVLVCLGRWEEALQYNCICGQSERSGIADFRVPLYSALINTMLENKDSAKKCWKEFTEAVESEGPPGPAS